jgi:hypothetical protein
MNINGTMGKDGYDGYDGYDGVMVGSSDGMMPSDDSNDDGVHLARRDSLGKCVFVCTACL